MVQNTFTLVPTAAALATAPRALPNQPMTSKQVVKAYKAAHRKPRLSRAEQRRQDQAEIARIRREQEAERKALEKEKASVKAKAARQKKKDEEAAKREERRRNGLPLVDVTASQGVLTALFKPRKVVKPMDTVQEERTASPEPVADPAPESENHSTGRDEPDEDKAAKDKADDSKPDDGYSENPPSPKMNPPLEQVHSRLPSPHHAQPPTTTSPKHASPTTNPPNQLDDLDDLLDSDWDALEAIDLDAMQPPPPAKVPPEAPAGEAVLACGSKPEPPSLPERKRPVESRYEEDLGIAKKPRFSSPRPQPPPLSTQYILYEFDDLFPTASQQLRELEETVPSPPPAPQTSMPPPKPVLQPSPHRQKSSSPATPARRKRFFTDTGSQERWATALHKSRCSAQLDHWRRKDRVEEPDVGKENIPPPAPLPPPPASQESEFGGGWLDDAPLDFDL
ncbi:hypothetical protein B0I35DRAFT_446919 [Stachybotrys elegans]|uniref:Uncharacterized protein n=1 Tax=Stachybotrys elegans TaxID=80388 RepID=A0A8K0SBF3_9HYPO|nr:hypothetical protein B0I35DRAFT_446919 [Stachybotrys elegans]